MTLYTASRSIWGDVHDHTQFVGGEQHFKFDSIVGETRQIAVLNGASSDDLIAMRIWADGIRQIAPVNETYLFLPYLPAARADRGTPLSAKTYANIVNEANLTRVMCLDPHSDVAPALYDRMVRFEAHEVIGHFWQSRDSEVTAVLAPDAGAAKRAQQVADLMKVPMFQATKHRDFETKRLSDFRVPVGLPEHGRILVVDDICDGGGTFVGLAQALGLRKERLGLWVTHGIFSYGAPSKLDDHYSWVGTTNSHPGHVNVKSFSNFHVFDLEEWYQEYCLPRMIV